MKDKEFKLGLYYGKPIEKGSLIIDGSQKESELFNLKVQTKGYKQTLIENIVDTPTIETDYDIKVLGTQIMGTMSWDIDDLKNIWGWIYKVKEDIENNKSGYNKGGKEYANGALTVLDELIDNFSNVDIENQLKNL